MRQLLSMLSSNGNKGQRARRSTIEYKSLFSCTSKIRAKREGPNARGFPLGPIYAPVLQAQSGKNLI